MQCSGVYFSELRLRLRSILTARASWAIALVLVAIQAAVTLAGGHDGIPAMFGDLGLSRSGVSSGKVWQLVTYGFLHGGFLHVGLNALCILMLGARVEHVLGRAQVWKTMIAGVLGGGIAHLLLSGEGEGEAILVGASGGCVALLILMMTLSPDSRMWPIPVSARNLGIGVMAAELLLALMNPQPGIPVFSYLGEILAAQGLGGWFQVSHACHFGGGLGGFLLGAWLLRPRVTAATLRRDRERREARRGKTDAD